MLAHTQEIMLTLQHLEEVVERSDLDSVQWYLMHRMLIKVAGKVRELQTLVESQRPGEPVLQVLQDVESSMKIS
jgi:hypothetical protein